MKIFHPIPFLCLLFLGCAGSPTTRVSPYSWEDPYWQAQNYESKNPETIIVTEGDLERNYREVARIYTEGGPKDKEEAFDLMRSRLSAFGTDAVIKVRKKNSELRKESWFFSTSLTFSVFWNFSSGLGSPLPF